MVSYIVRVVFVAYDKKQGKGRLIISFVWFQKIAKLLAEKNSKRTGGAAIMLVALLMSKQPNAELLIVAQTLVIANLPFSQIAV